MIKIIENLKDALKILPGIGDKTAQRLALFLLAQDKSIAQEIGSTIINAAENISHCSECNMLTDENPCRFCTDLKRDNSQLCIVENTADVFMMESTGEFNGKYFVLGNLLSPLDGIGAQELHLDILMRRLELQEINEIIIALSPSVEGETTISFIVELLKDWSGNITRLSTGLPFGGDLEYSNKLTVANALKHRFNLKG